MESRFPIIVRAIPAFVLLVAFMSCAPNPIDTNLNSVESSLRDLEQNVHGLSGKTLAADGQENLEAKAAVLRKAYSDVVRTDAATMSKEQENRWLDLRKRSIDVITDMMNLIAQQAPK